MDLAYRDKVARALYRALLSASMTERTDATGRPLILIKNGETVDALLSLMATIVSGSEVTSTPTKASLFTLQVRTKLGWRIAAIQHANLGFPFEYASRARFS